MQTEEQLTMMKLAGLEIVTEPAGEGLRRARVYRGHECVDAGRSEYPADAQDSEINIIFHFYLLKKYEQREAPKLLGMLPSQAYAQLKTQAAQSAQNYANQQMGNQQTANQQLATALNAYPNNVSYTDLRSLSVFKSISKFLKG